MYKPLYVFLLPAIMGIATLLPSASIHAVEPQSAIGHLEERLQQTQNMQNELTRQLQESRRMQDELIQQRRQVEEQEKQLSAQVQALQQQLEAQGKQLSARGQALQQQTEEQGKQLTAQVQALQQQINGLKDKKVGLLTIKTSDKGFSEYNHAREPFPVDKIISNTLLPEGNLTDSKISIPISGDYIATTTIDVCTSGATDYIEASVVFNGEIIANSSNEAKECGSAVATVFVNAKKGDLISGACSINSRVGGTCWFSLALIGSDR